MKWRNCARSGRTDMHFWSASGFHAGRCRICASPPRPDHQNQQNGGTQNRTKFHSPLLGIPANGSLALRWYRMVVRFCSRKPRNSAGFGSLNRGPEKSLSGLTGGAGGPCFFVRNRSFPPSQRSSPARIPYAEPYRLPAVAPRTGGWVYGRTAHLHCRRRP